MSQQESRKRTKQILVNGKREYFAEDVHTYLSEFTSARGYSSMRQSIEYIIRRVKDYIPAVEEVTIKNSE